MESLLRLCQKSFEHICTVLLFNTKKGKHVKRKPVSRVIHVVHGTCGAECLGNGNPQGLQLRSSAPPPAKACWGAAQCAARPGLQAKWFLWEGLDREKADPPTSNPGSRSA